MLPTTPMRSLPGALALRRVGITIAAAMAMRMMIVPTRNTRPRVRSRISRAATRATSPLSHPGMGNEKATEVFVAVLGAVLGAVFGMTAVAVGGAAWRRRQLRTATTPSATVKIRYGSTDF